MEGFELKSSQFRRERERSWRELERLIQRCEKEGVRRLGPGDLARLPSLYRSAVSSLSVARAISLDKSLLDYLENLVGRGYLTVYGTKRSVAQTVLRFVGHGFPSTVRAHAVHLAASAVILLLGIVCGFLLTREDPEWYFAFVPAEYTAERTPAASDETLRSVLYFEEEEGRGRLASLLNVFASFLFTHNAKIGILAFALGFAAGVPTTFLLFVNGGSLGAMAALYHSRGLGAEFWAWVLPHGVTELGAVCLCGAAGLAIGMTLLFPGRHTRLDAMAQRGRRVAMIVIGSLALFFVAALIEGFFRQLVHDVTARWSLAGISLVAWSAYFGLSGRHLARSADR